MTRPTNRILSIEVRLSDDTSIVLDRDRTAGAPVPGMPEYFYARDLNHAPHGFALCFLSPRDNGRAGSHDLEIRWAALQKDGSPEETGYRGDDNILLQIPAGAWSEVWHSSTDAQGRVTPFRTDPTGVATPLKSVSP